MKNKHIYEKHIFSKCFLGNETEITNYDFFI